MWQVVSPRSGNYSCASSCRAWTLSCDWLWQGRRHDSTVLATKTDNLSLASRTHEEGESQLLQAEFSLRPPQVQYTHTLHAGLHVQAHIYTHAHIHRVQHTLMHACVHEHTFVCTHTCMLTHMYICTHTCASHTCTHKDKFKKMRV